MGDTVKVSVLCLVYNHEAHIRKCLDGFVMQKTTFPFEVLIHDDASTDNSAAIIREYEAKYPEIIKPIYQTKNQHSQGVKITKTFLLPQVRGEYLAWCEGDDCWTDETKLQQQVDFLDAHPAYSCCYHRVLCNNLKANDTRYIPNIQDSRDFSVDEIVRAGAVFHISSLVLRSHIYREKPEEFTAKGFGDVPLYLYAAMRGKTYVLRDVMSVYNHGTVGSYTMRMAQASKEKKIAHEQDYIALLERANAFSEYRYQEAFSFAIDRLQFHVYLLSGNKKAARDKRYRRFYEQHKRQQRMYFVQKYLPFLRTIKQRLRKR